VAVKPVVQIDYGKAVTPLLDRLVVKVLTGERITAGGLIISETASMATGYLKAKVLAIGTGIKTKKGSLRPLDVQVGDTVLFSSYAGIKVEFNSEELEIIHETDVMGVVQD
jgi:chaperonin GroES